MAPQFLTPLRSPGTSHGALYLSLEWSFLHHITVRNMVSCFFECCGPEVCEEGDPLLYLGLQWHPNSSHHLGHQVLPMVLLYWDLDRVSSIPKLQETWFHVLKVVVKRCVEKVALYLTWAFNGIPIPHTTQVTKHSPWCSFIEPRIKFLASQDWKKHGFMFVWMMW